MVFRQYGFAPFNDLTPDEVDLLRRKYPATWSFYSLDGVQNRDLDRLNPMYLRYLLLRSPKQIPLKSIWKATLLLTGKRETGKFFSLLSREQRLYLYTEHPEFYERSDASILVRINYSLYRLIDRLGDDF